MKLTTLALLFTLAFATCADLVLAQTPASPGATPVISKKRHWEARFKELDTNGDGKLTLDEFLAGPMGQKTPEKAKTFFQTIDKGHTGSITLDQWLAAHAEEEGEPAAAAAVPGATPAPQPAPVASTPAPPTVHKEKIGLKKTPPEVQKAITKAVGVSHLIETEKFEEGGRTLYTGKYYGNKTIEEYTVDATGAVARIRLFYEDSLPKPVHKAITKHVGDGKIEVMEVCYDPGKTYYRVKFTTKDGKESQILVSESGVLE